MRLIISDNLAILAAQYIKNRIVVNGSLSKKTVLGLPTGSTPLGMYKELVRMNKAGEVSFKDVVTFNMDEYVGLSPDHPKSYNYFMYQNLFNHIDIKKENIHIPNGTAPDLVKECENYEKAIAQHAPLDIFVGGAGEDGHLAFNEPYSSLTSPSGAFADLASSGS